jgi:uncharacterized protein (DUF433 family)
VVAVSLTLNEAGFVVEQASTAINRAVDRGIIKARVQRKGNGRLRKIGAAELRFLAIAGAVERDLTPAARRKVYAAIRRLPANADSLALGVMEFRLADIDRRIATRLRQLAALKALVEERPNGDPVLRGTDFSVHIVAALAGGETTAEIMQDYPGLTARQIDAAVEYAKVYPKPGRKLPARSFKRMLGDMAASGVWDVETEAPPVSPRLVQ